MPAYWKCEKCGFEDSIQNLRGTVVETVKTKGRSYSIYAVEDELIEKGGYDEMDCVALLFRCPKCGNQEGE